MSEKNEYAPSRVYIVEQKIKRWKFGAWRDGYIEQEFFAVLKIHIAMKDDIEIGTNMIKAVSKSLKFVWGSFNTFSSVQTNPFPHFFTQFQWETSFIIVFFTTISFIMYIEQPKIEWYA